MNISVTKLIATNINTTQAYIYFNIYLLTSIYFGTRIISLNKKQCKELKWLYEKPILAKLKLSCKMPKDVLYSRRSALSVGLILPETVVTIAQLKLYFGNKRMQSEIFNMIELNEQYREVESCLNETRY